MGNNENNKNEKPSSTGVLSTLIFMAAAIIIMFLVSKFMG